jgi:hypothetical protein
MPTDRSCGAHLGHCGGLASCVPAARAFEQHRFGRLGPSRFDRSAEQTRDKLIYFL